MSLSFWRFGNNYQTVPEITNILQRPDFTLEEVLDDPEIIQELIAENGALIAYLGTAPVLESLVNYIIEDDDFGSTETVEDSSASTTTNNNNDDNDNDNNTNATVTTKSDDEDVAITENGASEATSTNESDEIIDDKEEFNRLAIDEDDNDKNLDIDDDNVTTKEITDNKVEDGEDTNEGRRESEEDDDENDLHHNTEEEDQDEEHDGGFDIEDENRNQSNFDDSYNSDNGLNFDEEEDEEDEEESPEAGHHRRTQIAAEILSQENWTITHAFIKENPHLLEQLWTILDKPAPLSMSSSTYFMKINEHLLDQHLEDMISFILSQDSLVERFMRHIDNPPLMDFLLKVISTDKGRELSTGVIDVLQEKKLIPSLISFLGPDHPSTEQSLAADFLKAFITISANSNTDNSTIGPNELTRELVSQEMVEKLVNLMLYGGSGLANSVGIIIEIIRKNNSDYDIVPVLYITVKSHPPLPTDPIYLGTLVKVFTENIPKFTAMLEKPMDQVLETPFGTIEPLGFERFKICELVAELLHCSNMALLNDEKGEPIVKERDDERKRLKLLLKQQHSEHLDQSQESQEHDDDDDEGTERSGYGEEDISRDINNLEITEDRFLDDDEDAEEKRRESERNDEELEDDDERFNQDLEMTEDNKDQTEADFSVDMEDEDSLLHSVQNNDEEERMIRENPVVGDQLKIALSDNNVIITILNMFFKFPWNNFLHNVVFDIVQQVLNGSMEIGYNKFLAIELFGKGRITKLIVEGQKKCEDYEEQTGLRLGYMGHLTLIAEEVVKFISLYSPENMSPIIYEAVSDEEWNTYVNEVLVETREKYNAILGGTIGEDDELDENSQGLILDPNTDHDLGLEYRNEEDDDDEEEEEDEDENGNSGYRQIQLHDSDKAQYDEEVDQFSRYMSQQITNDLPDKFGSSDEDEEDDEPGSWTMSSDFTSKINNSYYQHHSGNSNQQQQQLPYLQLPVTDSHSSNCHQDEEEDDEDDYIDPNDDGQSYVKKNHPLYTPSGDLLDQFGGQDSQDNDHLQLAQGSYADSGDVADQFRGDPEECRTDPLSDVESDEDEDSNSIKSTDDDDDDDDDDEDVDGDDDDDVSVEERDDEQKLKNEDLSLMRSTSKGEMGWDDDEQRRLMTVASFIQSHGNEK